MAIQGLREYRRRLKAIRTVFKPVGKTWAEDTKSRAQRKVKVRTGATRRSIRVKNASQKKAAVEARGGARFLEAGTKAHTLQAKKFSAMKFDVAGRPQFAKKVRHPGMKAQPFLHESARDALAANPMADELIELWNRAA